MHEGQNISVRKLLASEKNAVVVKNVMVLNPVVGSPVCVHVQGFDIEVMWKLMREPNL